MSHFFLQKLLKATHISFAPKLSHIDLKTVVPHLGPVILLSVLNKNLLGHKLSGMEDFGLICGSAEDIVLSFKISMHIRNNFMATHSPTLPRAIFTH